MTRGRSIGLCRWCTTSFGAIARQRLRQERPGHTLQPTALVNEAYLKLVDLHRLQWHDRAHFFAVAAQIIRRILVDHARRHAASKRGGGVPAVMLEVLLEPAVEQDFNVLAVDDTLSRLAALDARQARLVELRFFGGLNVEETAEVLGVSSATVKREWQTAKAWLYRELPVRDMTPERWREAKEILGTALDRPAEERACLDRRRPAAATSSCATRSSRCSRATARRTGSWRPPRATPSCFR